MSNAGALLGSRLAVAILGWAGTILIVRTLSTEEFGQFAFVFGLLGMLSIITDMGMGRVATSGVLDEERDKATFAGTYVVLRTVLGLLGYAIALAFVALAQYPIIVVQATAVAGLVILLATPSAAYDLAFQANMRLTVVGVADIVGRAAQLALTVAIVLRGGTLLWLTVPAILAEVVILGIKYPRALALMPLRYAIRLDIWKELAREAIPLSIGGALVTLYYRVDSVMLSKLDTFTSVGVYGVAYKFADLARFTATRADRSDSDGIGSSLAW